jgi:hypothetical protein
MTARMKIKKHWSTRMSRPNERVAMTDDGAFPALSAKTTIPVHWEIWLSRSSNAKENKSG